MAGSRDRPPGAARPERARIGSVLLLALLFLVPFTGFYERYAGALAQLLHVGALLLGVASVGLLLVGGTGLSLGPRPVAASWGRGRCTTWGNAAFRIAAGLGALLLICLAVPALAAA
jgi:hypothetical protein